MTQAAPPPSTTDLSSSPTQPVIIRLADVAPAPVQWLWPDRIPLGKLTLLVGEAAVGKSLLALDLAARISAKSMPSVPEGDPPSSPHGSGHSPNTKTNSTASYPETAPPTGRKCQELRPQLTSSKFARPPSPRSAAKQRSLGRQPVEFEPVVLP